jgi:phosphinothricin acetyltransferase
MTTVTEARAEHVGDIVALIGQLRAQEGLDEPVTAGSVLAYMDDPATSVFVAIETAAEGDAADLVKPAAGGAAAVLGVLSLRVMLDLFHGRPSALIQELVVDETARGRGIGGALLDAALVRARELGCVEIGVTTGEHNDAGQAAYRSRGFERDGVYFELHLNG